MIPENTGKIQGNRKFQKGVSGNPAGRPKGARNRATLMIERLLESAGQEICAAVIEGAKGGDMQAAKIVLDRLLPPRKDRPIEIDLPKMERSADLASAIGYIVNAVGSGQISPLEGEALARIIDIHTKALELTEFEIRLAALEGTRNERVQ